MTKEKLEFVYLLQWKDQSSMKRAWEQFMAENGMNQNGLSKLLGISSSRVSEFLNGKSEPTLMLARDISVKLDIDASIVLGV